MSVQQLLRPKKCKSRTEKHQRIVERNRTYIMDRSEEFRERRDVDRMRSLILLHCESADFSLEKSGGTFTARGQFTGLRPAELANALGALQRGALKIAPDTLFIEGVVDLYLVASGFTR